MIGIELADETVDDEKQLSFGSVGDRSPTHFDFTRLAVGRRYEFALADGRVVVGVFQALETLGDGDVELEW